MAFYVAGWLGLLLAGMPIAFTLGVIGYLFLWIEGGSMVSSPQRLFAGLDSFPLLAVPAFVLAGELMNTGGITTRIFKFSRVLVGHISGGLGHVNVVANVIMSGISGSALADAAGIGTLIIKEMKKQGFDAPFAGSLTAAACILGPLIPPSIILVIYAVTASASAGRLLIAGTVPGVLTAIALMIYVYFISKKRGYPRYERATKSEIWIAFKEAWLAILAPFVIMGGIVAGIFTATECAAVAAVYALVLGLFIYKELSWSDLPRIFRDSAMTTAVIGMIVACANLTTWILTREQVPQHLADALLSFSDKPWVILLLINILLLVLGCFMEGMAIMILTVPVLLPVVLKLGIDPVHFGVVMVMNLMIGLLTPPFGMALFVVARVGDIPFTDLAKAILPFIPPLLIVLAIITFIPEVVLFLPRLFYGN
ncbi:TRAP transporter large permease [Bosea sp. PAMC 26642]|uniref:TRAP transporter large permease n=1 Tax=Bosea sp. (strain PAMC 26642) TaxID=1792307 RepID=UPI00076FF377|nr:TRAP transporter large permease [Bosea sp. PAMC 26642]AMJ61528.1 ABC transporter permease [Bosea sp. PAMC 26642]